MSKFLCSNNSCNWHGDSADVLSATNPFDEEDTLYACPDCKTIGSMVPACDKSDCWNPVTCGFPSKNGYCHTCGKHFKPQK